eukprot:352825-Chlamydomonas_euryale.AAC.11
MQIQRAGGVSERGLYKVRKQVCAPPPKADMPSKADQDGRKLGQKHGHTCEAACKTATFRRVAKPSCEEGFILEKKRWWR